jgi:hypothetical protein
MNEENSIAVQRMPQELWWMILEEVIDVPRMFVTTYEGSDWLKDASSCLVATYPNESYQNSEKIRKIIGSVCRSWQVFALYKKDRQIVLEIKDKFPGTRLNARRVHLRADPDELPFAQGTILECEILAASYPSVITRFKQLSFPRLRRLQLWFSDKGDPHFFDVLSVFPNIAWLDCEVSYEKIPAIKARCELPTLSNLQVLRYKCRNCFVFPLCGISLPSLRYLYLHFFSHIGRVPILDILLFYSQSVQFIVVRRFSLRRVVPIIEFPSWNQFPQLKELELGQGWSIQFEPLPPNHPLQNLSAQHETFDAIPSLLEGKNMRKLTLRNAHWTTTGRLVGRTVIDAEKGAELWERAKVKGVQLEVTERGKKALDRDEALAAASQETLD